MRLGAFCATLDDMKLAAFAFGAALFAAPFVQAKECAVPPVRTSGQAVCYATAYAEKNRLPHAPLNKRATRRQKTWTVSFADNRPDAPSKGWQVEVDTETGTVTRFQSFKKPER